MAEARLRASRERERAVLHAEWSQLRAQLGLGALKQGPSLELEPRTLQTKCPATAWDSTVRVEEGERV